MVAAIRTTPVVEFETVDLHQQLVQRLLLLVVAAERIGAARPAERVQFVDENDRRRPFARLDEEIAHPRRADADEHFDEFGAVDGEEGHARFAGDGARQQRLAGAGRPDQKDALRDARAEPAVFLRVLEEADDFRQFLLGLVDPGDVVEGRLGVGLDEDLGLAAPDRHQAAKALAIGEATEPEDPDAEEQQHRNDPGQQRREKRALDLAGEFHVMLFELIGEIGGDDRGLECPLVVLRGLPCSLDGAARDPDLGDLVALQVAQELAVGNDGDLLVERPDVLQDEDADQGDDEVPGVPLVLLAYRRHRGSDSRNLFA